MASPYVALTADAVVIRPLDEMDCDWTVVGQLDESGEEPVIVYHPGGPIFWPGKTISLHDFMFIVHLRGPLMLKDERTINANTT